MSESIELILEQLDELEEKDKEIERLNKELEEKEAILGGIQQLEAEIERLNNIINELEKWFDDMNLESLASFDDYDIGEYNAYKKVINKLQELKGNDKK